MFAVVSISSSNVCMMCYCRVVESMVSDGLIEDDDKPVVMRSLLLRHRHVHDDRFRFSISSRKHSSYTSLQVRSRAPTDSCCLHFTDLYTTNDNQCITEIRGAAVRAAGH